MSSWNIYAANDSGNFHETETIADRSSVIAGGCDSPLSVQNIPTIQKTKGKKKQSNDMEDLNNTISQFCIFQMHKANPESLSAHRFFTKIDHMLIIPKRKSQQILIQ